MTLYSLLNAPDVFRAGIAGAPVTNWRNYDTIYTERYLGLPAENEEGYKSSSAVEYAGKLQAKLLMVHNVEDDNVMFQNTMQMADAFEHAGNLFDMVIYPQKSHGVGGPIRRQLLEKTTDFFEKNLMYPTTTCVPCSHSCEHEIYAVQSITSVRGRQIRRRMTR